MDIIKNQHIRIYKNENGFYLESYRRGFSIHDFNRILNENPDIKITNFTVIRNALVHAPQQPVKFGEVKSRIDMEISSNDMNAFLTLNVDNSELAESNRSNLLSEILSKLQDNGVIYGVKTDVLHKNLKSKTPFLIAEGFPPVNGKDSVIRMFELKDPRPVIKDDGKVNYYELNLINKVNEGDWLGERSDPTEGVPGKTVKGETIKQLPGKRYPLFYDPNSVKEVYKAGITTLISKIKGAVHYDGDQISVSNYLEITSDVDFNTGNIDFDGFLTVKGAITDNFFVAAKNDIEILGEFGIGSVKEVVSRNGNIFIKGGIAGKNKAIVRSTKDIYTKYISDATVICDGTVNVGYYCMNSNIIAKQLIVESKKGQIIGGKVQAEQKVSAAFLGNAGEKRTQIVVKGFNRKLLKERLDKLQAAIHEARNNLTKAKQLFSVYSYSIESGARQFEEYEAAKERYFALKDQVKNLESELKAVLKCFKVKGEGEIDISKRVYPNTVIEMHGEIKEIRKEIIATNYFLQDGMIREI